MSKNFTCAVCRNAMPCGCAAWDDTDPQVLENLKNFKPTITKGVLTSTGIKRKGTMTPERIKELKKQHNIK